jgi:hypothetical protein
VQKEEMTINLPYGSGFCLTKEMLGSSPAAVFLGEISTHQFICIFIDAFRVAI